MYGTTVPLFVSSSPTTQANSPSITCRFTRMSFTSVDTPTRNARTAVSPLIGPFVSGPTNVTSGANVTRL